MTALGFADEDAGGAELLELLLFGLESLLHAPRSSTTQTTPVVTHRALVTTVSAVLGVGPVRTRRGRYPVR